MSSNSPQYRVAVAVVALLVAAVAPWAGAGGASAAPSASFDRNVVSADRGDVVNITFETSQAATVNLGSRDQGFLLQVDVGEDTNVLHLNTYKAGREGVPLSEMVWTTDGSIRNSDLRTDRLSKPLEATEYTMNVTINGVQRDLGNFVVEDRVTSGIDARIAPHDADVESLGPKQVGGATTPIADNGTVARGDWLVLRVNATGLTGTVSKGAGLNGVRSDGDANGTPPSEVFDEPGIDLSFEQVGRTMNVNPNEFDADGVERLVRAPDSGFYAFVATGEHGVSAGDRYNVTVSVSEDSPLADEREAVSTEVRVVERRVDLQYEGDRLIVENETTIRANATLAPDTTVNVTAQDDEIPPLYKPKMETIGNDRSFAVTFDFSDVESGREFELRLRDQDQIHDAVVGPVPTETPEPTEPNATVEPNATAETPDPNATTEAPEPNTTARPTTTAETTAVGLTQVAENGDTGPLTQRTVVEGVTDVPGFDAASLAVALLAAALLAVRRT